MDASTTRSNKRSHDMISDNNGHFINDGQLSQCEELNEHSQKDQHASLLNGKSDIGNNSAKKVLFTTSNGSHAKQNDVYSLHSSPSSESDIDEPAQCSFLSHQFVNSYSNEGDDSEAPCSSREYPRVNGGTLWTHWTSEELGIQLAAKGLQDVAQIFTEQKITGKVLHRITEKDLASIGISEFGRRLEVLMFIEDLTSQHRTPISVSEIHTSGKVLNDAVHGHMELHPLCVRIMDTPEFQRLRDLKQLGAVYFVYPSASHNRFEHCIGVCHLAGQLVRSLQHMQPGLQINHKDILCVEIAGLCHDLGHGPFSHLFGRIFIPAVLPDRRWQHEESSIQMFDHMMKENNLHEEFAHYGLKEADIQFIKEQIVGPPVKDNMTDWPYKGRAKNKAFLYEVVANKRNGIDVDKWDYFARDCHNLGFHSSFDHTRFIRFARVIKVDDELQICYREKEVANLYNMFYTRHMLHKRAYQHKVCCIIEHMISEALQKANDYIMIPGKDGIPRKISECIDDMYAYTLLTDHVYWQILMSTERELEPARKVLLAIQRRQLYKCVGQSQPTPGKLLTQVNSEIISEIIEIINNSIVDTPMPPFSLDDLLLDIVSLDFGMKDKNPVDCVRFYSKNQLHIAQQVHKDQVSQLLPGNFAEQLIRLYCKRPGQANFEVTQYAFRKWCDIHNMARTKDGGEMMELTPMKRQFSDLDEGVLSSQE